MPKKPRVTFVRTEFNASGYYRMDLPAKILIEKGWPVTTGQLSYQDFASADILVFQRITSKFGSQEIAKWKAKGKKIIVDFDDNIFLIENHNPAKKVFGPEELRHQSVVAEMADALTVTTQPLADSYQRFNKRIHVLPNSVDENNLSREPIQGGPLTIGWQGSATHAEDLKTIKSPINTLSRRYGFNFVLFGFKPPGVFRKAAFRPWLPFSDELPHLDRIADFSIGLCPLTRSSFNDCKSDIKFLEYSLLGIPTIASRIVTYDTIETGKTGYIARNSAEWERFLEILIKDEAKRRELGRNAKDYVASERTIQHAITGWEEVFCNL